jgi:hypothetical protein
MKFLCIYKQLILLSILPSEKYYKREMGYLRRLSCRCSIPGRGKTFHSAPVSRSALGPTQPPIQRVPKALSSGVKRQGRQADHSPPTNDVVKKTWIYTSTTPYVGARGSVVVKALCYKPEGRGFYTRWGKYLNLPNLSGRTRPWGLLLTEMSTRNVKKKNHVSGE